jgi:hypothetical protein
MKSDCHISFGCTISKRVQDERGRFLGSGVINPAACKIRRIVDLDGAGNLSRSRCQPIVTGPASNPSAVNWTRNSITR